MSKNDSKKIALAAARSGDDKHADPITVLDLAGRSTLADYVVMMNVESVPQLEAVDDEIVRRLKQEGVYCLYRDGMRSRSWKVIDYGGVLVHIFDAEAAVRFSLADLYPGAKQVEWRDPTAPRPAARPAPEPETGAVPEEPGLVPPAIDAEASAPVKKPVKKPAVKKPAVKKPAGRAPVKKTAKKAAKPAQKAAARPAKKAAAKKVVKPAKKAAAKKTVKKTVKKTAKKAAPANKAAARSAKKR
jgi:ribosome-associated protein